MSYFHPERMPVLPARRRQAARRQIEDVVERSARSGRRHAKPAAILAGAAAVVLTTGAAAFAIVAYQPVTNTSQARCYAIADLSSRAYTTIAVPGRPGSRVQVRHALSVCAALFRQGFLVAGAAKENPAPGSGSHRIPALVVCTLHDRSAAVIPGRRGTCARLRLPSAGAGLPRPGTAAPIP